ncbi:hemolysin family protein [uncultured Parasutterella sp.]|uniref:hemolysin family protein n=2 Tax=uncultured Parasutterella sp. TaxID=1263098 RepID=UPI00272AA8D3|nr:hemolysin family protein [uncultured Parasutterella sp.]
MSVWFDVICLSILILMNGFFAMSEISIVTARKSKLQVLSEQGASGAKLALSLSENPTRALSTIQVGITSIGILSGIVGESALVDPFSNFMVSVTGISMATARVASMVIVVILITYFSIVVGELVPKRIGLLGADAIARFVAKPIHWLSLIALPFVKLLSFSTEFVMKLIGTKENDQKITEEEIHSMIDEGGLAGVIDAQEHVMVKNIFRLDDRSISSLMIPRGEVEYIDLDDSREVNMKKVLESNHSRLPVCKGGLDDVVGVVTTRQLLKQIVSVGKPNFKVEYDPPLYVPESLTGMELLENFRASDAALALVVDEYGAILGLVTPHDVLEAIAGEFKPETPEDAQIIKKSDTCYEVDGLLPIPELKDLLALHEVPEEMEDRYTTAAGMVIFLLEKLPRPGDRVSWGGWEFTVRQMDGRRLDRILITKLPEAKEEEEES